MIRLGIRLATAGGRGAVVGIILAAVAVGLGTAVLLFALSFQPALMDRAERAAWRSPDVVDHSPTTRSGLLFLPLEDRYAERELFEVRVAPLNEAAPIPPGIDRVPAPGEAFVSPALERLMAATPADQLGDRIGRIAGTIGDQALRSPDELVAVIGGDPAALERQGAFTVTAFPERGHLPSLPPAALLIVALCVAGALAPVAVFVASATRLSAARREQRLSALRLVGATPLQTARLAAVEAFVATALGATLGVGFFFLLRPLVAQIPLDGATWFAGSMAPPVVQAVLLLVLVLAVGVGAALFSLRRIAVSPLGVQRRVAPPMPRTIRLAPLGLSIVALLAMLVFFRRTGGVDDPQVFLVAGSFAGIILGIAIAGPWLTAVVGQVLRRLPAGGATLLAARRLTDDPRGSFGSIAGVIMAIFVATTFLTFAATARTLAGGAIDLEARPGTVIADLPAGEGTAGATLAARLPTLAGVRTVVPIQEIEVSAMQYDAGAWVVPCQDLLAILEPRGATCGAGRVHRTGTVDLPAGVYTVASAGGDPNGGGLVPSTITVRMGDVDALTPAGAEPAFPFPDLVIDPSVLPKTAQPFDTTRLYVATDGSTAAMERTRTAILAAAPAASVRRADERIAAAPIYDEIGRVVILGLAGTMALAGCSLAVAVTTAVADRRRQFVFLRSAGMSVTSLRSLVLLQAGVPLVAVAAFSAGLGVLVSQALFATADVGAVLGLDLGTLGVLIGSIGLAMLVVVLTLPGLDRMTRPETLRVE